MSDQYAGELDGMDLHHVVRELGQMRGALGKRALTIRNEETVRRAAARDLAVRQAQVRANTAGTVQAKNDAAILDEKCQKLLAEFDVAEAAENYAKRMARSDETDVSNLQTQARLIEQSLRLAGMPDRRSM